MKKVEFRYFIDELEYNKDNSKTIVSFSFEEDELNELVGEFFFFLETCGFDKNQIVNAIIKFETMEQA